MPLDYTILDVDVVQPEDSCAAGVIWDDKINNKAEAAPAACGQPVKQCNMMRWPGDRHFFMLKKLWPCFTAALQSASSPVLSCPRCCHPGRAFYVTLVLSCKQGKAHRLSCCLNRRQDPSCRLRSCKQIHMQVPAIAQTRQMKLRLMHQRADAAAAYYVMREAIASNDSPQTLCQLQTIAVATVVHESMQAYGKSEAPDPVPWRVSRRTNADSGMAAMQLTGLAAAAHGAGSCSDSAHDVSSAAGAGFLQEDDSSLYEPWPQHLPGSAAAGNSPVSKQVAGTRFTNKSSSSLAGSLQHGSWEADGVASVDHLRIRGQAGTAATAAAAAPGHNSRHEEAQAAEEDEEQEEEGEQQLEVEQLLSADFDLSRDQTRTLLAAAGSQAHGIVREHLPSELRPGWTFSTQPAAFTAAPSLLLGPPFFNHSRDLKTALQAALALLRLPRSSLGIAAASKGAVAGRLLLRCRPGEAWQDCSLTGPAGRAIPGEVGAIQAMQMRPAGARFILVVEKDAVFQRLVEDRLFEAMPCILLTGRGMPDIASRAFLAALVAASSSAADGSRRPLPVLGLVDWNPGGVAILLSYKHGSAAMGLEGQRYAVPSLAWLGVTSDMLQDVPASACQPLTPRDRAQLVNLKARLAGCCPSWLPELEEMEGLGLKADIEALYAVMGHAGLAQELAQRMMQRQYLA
ncbi:Spo11/DNA topoisomerase VI subunit A [Scenedesmus sp. NREL 46B-D3]|nr:Spo11/DNA topoisomerase VI subunit A [Scenedesmus sp. NREL 46B-D3]